MDLALKKKLIQTKLYDDLQAMFDFVKKEIPSKGDKSDRCQQLAILNAIQEVEYTVSGISINDLIKTED